MKNKNRFLVIAFLIGSLIQYSYQGVQAQNNYELKVQGLRIDNKVSLRWLLDDSKQWKQANKIGFIIERAEGESKQFKQLNTTPLKPASMEIFKSYDKETYIYKSGVIVNGVMNATKSTPEEDDQLYNMLLVASSVDIKAAYLTASGFLDSTVQTGKSYTYRIRINDPKIKYGPNNTYIASAYSYNIPEAPKLTADFGNKRVGFNWDTKEMQEPYFAYLMERSTDSIKFETVSIPLIKVNGQDEKEEDKGKMQYNDSIPNKIKFYYRLRGVCAFGVLSKPSNVVSGIASRDLTMMPLINSVDSTSPNNLTIGWTLPDTMQEAVHHYEIYRSKKADTNFVKIGEVPGGMITKKELAVVIKDPSTYFIVKAFGFHKNQVTVSPPYLYQLIDSIPPAIPVAMKGKVDSLGIVTLNWTANTEPDLLGYRILRAQKKEDEFAILNAVPSAGNVYRDTLPTDQLNTVMYYKIAAVDNRYNESKASDWIEVKRPDYIPPAPPRLELVRLKDNTVYVEWVKSFSIDVASYQLFRMSSDDSTQIFKQIFTAQKTDTSFIDKDVKPGITYYYKVAAKDEGNLSSTQSDEMSVSIPKPDVAKKGVKSLNVYRNTLDKYIELSWQNSEPDAMEYWIGRTAPGQEFTIVGILPANKKRFVDEDLKPNTTYKYAVKVVYKDGTSSKFERVEVNY